VFQGWLGTPTLFSCARWRSQPGRSTGTSLVQDGSKSQRSSCASQMSNLILAQLMSALRFLPEPKDRYASPGAQSTSQQRCRSRRTVTRHDEGPGLGRQFGGV
jgi:hypothetical protein